MKRILPVIFALVLVFSVTACTAQVATLPVGELTIEGEPKDVSAEDYEKDLHGMVSYMVDNQVVAGEATTMSYDFIGAVNGFKFLFNYNSKQVAVELYEFDTENLNETATAILDSVRANGSFKSLDKDVPAILSEDERFMMVYISPSEDEAFVSHQQRAEEKFNEFE